MFGLDESGKLTKFRNVMDDDPGNLYGMVFSIKIYANLIFYFVT